jgi:outer membrane protein assembly factor BamB
MAEGTLGRMAGRARRMSAAGLVLTGGMVAGLAGPASAAVRPPQLSLSASAASPAASVQVTGAGFRGLEAVTISLGTTRLATARTSRTGHLGPVKITIPAAEQPGQYRISAAAARRGQSALAQFTVDANWTQDGSGPTHNAYNSYESVLTPADVSRLAVKWAVDPGYPSAWTAGPVIDNGIGYVAGEDSGRVVAVQMSTGKELWSWYGYGLEGLAAVNGTVYTSADINNTWSLVALGSGGKQLWTSPAGPVTGLTVSGGVVYGIDNAGLVAVSAATGKLLWSTVVTQVEGGCTEPAISGAVAYVSCADGSVYALSTATGAKLWSYTTPGLVKRLSEPVVAGGIVYVPGFYNQTLYAISTTSHNLLWRFSPGTDIPAPPTTANGTVYVSSWDGTVFALAATTGKTIWSHTTEQFPTTLSTVTSPVAANGVVYVQSGQSQLFAYSAKTGATLWTYYPGASDSYFSGPVVVNGNLYVATWDSGIDAFGLR